MCIRDRSCLLLNQIGIDIYRVGYNDNQRILCVFHNILRDVSGNACVHLCQIQTGLSFLTRNASSHDDDLRVCTFLISALLDTYLAVESCTMGNIKGRTLCLLLIYIDQNDLSYLRAQHQSVADGFSYVSCSDHNDLV